MSRYIDADALLKYKAQLYDENGVGFYAVGTGNILRIPTADVVEVVHAEWIKNWEIGWSACSHCGKGYLWEDYKGVADWNYCPNCGAKLDAERREDEEIH